MSRPNRIVGNGDEGGMGTAGVSHESLRECDMLHFRQPDRASPIDEPVLPMLRRCAAPDEAAMVASRGILALSVRCAEGPKDLAPSASFLRSLVSGRESSVGPRWLREIKLKGL
jgi:hypothetical protein